MSDFSDYASLINQSVSQNNAWSAQQAATQMQFQERMSNTAHQREVADLKAAGLNPVLSANSGASTPNGAMAESDNSGTAALTELLTTMIETENLNARAALRASSSSGNYYSKDPLLRIAQDFLEGFFGSSGEDALENAGKGAREFVDKITNGSPSGFLRSVLSSAGSGLSSWFEASNSAYQAAKTKAGLNTRTYKTKAMHRGH